MPPSTPETAPSVDAIDTYLAQIGRYELLDVEQQYELAGLMQEGRVAMSRVEAAESNGGPQLTEEELEEQLAIVETGRVARRTFINHNLRLVVSIASRYIGKGLDYIDLVQEGNCGLIRAVDKFDTAKGCTISTYATWWIRQSIQRAIQDKTRIINVPVHLYADVEKVKAARHELEQAGILYPDVDMIAAQSGISPKRVNTVLDCPADAISLNTLISSDGDAELGDFVADPAAERDFQAVFSALDTETAEQLLIASGLKAEEEDIVRRRFGLPPYDPDPMQLGEIGKQYSLSGAAVSEKVKKALFKLRLSAMEISDLSDLLCSERGSQLLSSGILSNTEAQVLTMRYGVAPYGPQGMTPKEIAEQLGVSYPTVIYRIKKALQQLISLEVRNYR